MTNKREKETVVTAISKVGKKDVDTEACLVVIYGINLGKRYNLNLKTQIIGRSDSSHIVVDQESVSRQHAKIINTGTSVSIMDLGSTNGTYVNDVLVDETKLKDGSFIKIGRTIFKYLSGANIEADYHEEIYRLTTTDGLTRIYNKRYFVENLERELNRAERYHRHVSLCLFDIDHFKNINDKHGHLAGDDILYQLAELVKSNTRREDIVARYGGEEFAVVLPEVDQSGTVQFANKIRETVAEYEFEFEDDVIPVTISIGIASVLGKSMKTTEFIRQADTALYEAKRLGRNRVEVFQDE